MITAAHFVLHQTVRYCSLQILNVCYRSLLFLTHRNRAITYTIIYILCCHVLYIGVMGKSHYSHGGGGNYLCLPLDPEFPSNRQAGLQSHSLIYGVEYQGSAEPHLHTQFTGVHDQDAPCAMCEVQGRSQVAMFPAKQTCPDGWTLEYGGLLASERTNHKNADYICVSSGMETTAGGQPDQNGGLVYVVEAVCGSLPCPPYQQGFELSCVVCTK